MLILRNIVRAGTVCNGMVERHRRTGLGFHGGISVANADPKPVVWCLLSVKQDFLIFPVLDKFPHQNRTGGHDIKNRSTLGKCGGSHAVGCRVNELAHFVLIMNFFPFAKGKIGFLIKGIIKIDLHRSILTAVLPCGIFQKLDMINLFQNHILGNRNADTGDVLRRQHLIRFFHVGKADFCSIVIIIIAVKVCKCILKIILIRRRTMRNEDTAIGNTDFFQRFIHKRFFIHINTDHIRNAGITDSGFSQRF